MKNKCTFSHLPSEVNGIVTSICSEVDMVALDVECAQGVPTLIQLASEKGIALLHMAGWNGD